MRGIGGRPDGNTFPNIPQRGLPNIPKPSRVVVDRGEGFDNEREINLSKLADKHGNVEAEEGVDRCGCGAKYWENDRCVSCGEKFRPAEIEDEDQWVVQAVWDTHSTLRIEVYNPGVWLVRAIKNLPPSQVKRLANRQARLLRAAGKTVSVELEALELAR